MAQLVILTTQSEDSLKQGLLTEDAQRLQAQLLLELPVTQTQLKYARLLWVADGTTMKEDIIQVLLCTQAQHQHSVAVKVASALLQLVFSLIDMNGKMIAEQSITHHHMMIEAEVRQDRLQVVHLVNWFVIVKALKPKVRH
jgi:hypothetical protein